MPFLNKAILIEILKTYPGADLIEIKYKSLVNEYKETPPSFIQLLTDSSIKIKNGSSRWFGYNTNEDSEACYLEMRALIDDATKNNNIEAWADILCTAGEGGCHTYSRSVIKSELCHTAFALVMYIRNQISDKVKSIKDPRTTDPDEVFALKVRDSINHRIAETKLFIQDAKENIKRSHNLKLSSLFANKLAINIQSGQEFHTSSLKMIEVAQRHLFFLGDDTLKKDAYIKPAQEIFDRLPFYSSELRKKYNLSEEQVGNLKLHLPMFLQSIYPSLHIRDNRKDLRHIVNEDTVIASFEKLEQIKLDEVKLVKSTEPKLSATPVISTPKESDAQELPIRSAVTTLTTPSLLSKHDALTIEIDGTPIMNGSLMFAEESDQVIAADFKPLEAGKVEEAKPSGLLAGSLAAPLEALSSLAMMPTDSVRHNSPVSPSQQSSFSSAEHEGKHSNQSQTLNSNAAHIPASSQSNEERLFQPKIKKQRKQPSKLPLAKQDDSSKEASFKFS